MKLRSIASFLFLAGLFFNPLTWGAALHAGAGSVVINPTAPPEEQFEIDAIVLEAGGTYVAFCSVDTCALNQTLVAAVVQRLASQGSAVGHDNLMLSATHTHTGAFPGLLPGAILEVAFGAFNQTNVDACADLVAQAVHQAEQQLQPALMRIAETNAPAYCYNRSYPGGPTDPTLNAFSIETPGGQPLGYLVNYGAHATLLFQTGFVGRDYPGGIAAGLRDACGSNVPVVYVSGAAGNVGPAPPSGSTPREQADALGLALATVALSTLSTAPAIADATLAARTRSVPMPSSVLETVAPQTAVLQDFRVNDTVFLSAPGEPCSQLGVALRQNAVLNGADHAFVCALTSDYAGYHTNDTEYFGAQYESQMCLYGPLMMQWYLSNHLPANAQGWPTWQYTPMLTANRDSYAAGVAQGMADSDVITTAWNALHASFEQLVPLVPVLYPLPPESQALIDRLGLQDSTRVAEQLAAYFARQAFAPLYTDAQYAKIIGLAEGSGLTVDAVTLLQFGETPIGVPPQYIPVLQSVGIRGIDFMKPANFTASPSSGSKPLTVEFSDRSTPRQPPILDWTWDFGDGTTSHVQNPTHVYDRAGVYTVTLRVTTASDQNTEVKADFVTVSPPMPVCQPPTLLALVFLMIGVGLLALRARKTGAVNSGY